MNSQREAFEKVFPVPEGCFWNGECYLSHNVHNYNDMRDANDQNMRLEVWQAATEQGVGEATVPMPTTVAQAKGMALVGTSWLETNAPEELKPTGGGVPECFQYLYEHAKGLVSGTDWNNGTAAKHHRLRLIDAVGGCATYLATQQPPEQE